MGKPQPPSTLGEVVSTDPHDPFVWLSTHITEADKLPTENGKHLLWMMYRMNGNFPVTDKDLKWRDLLPDNEDIFRNLTQVDRECAVRYQEYLDSLRPQ